MTLMSNELANEQQQLQNRQLAGVILKNTIKSDVDLPGTNPPQRGKAWMTMIGPAEKAAIKQAVLACLGSPVSQGRHTAAQVVAAIGILELPQNQWPELIQGLVHNVTQSGNDFLKQSSLEAIGFICEEVDPAVLSTQGHVILTAVIQGMRKEETNLEVRLAGTQALSNALEFVKSNFEAEVERNYIMQTVCETTQCEKKEIKVAAYECLVQIAELYYDKLPQYMSALYQLTLAAIQKATMEQESDEVGQQAVEFWTTICDEELDLQEEAQEAREENKEPERKSHNFVAQGLAHLVPLLLEAMCKQEEDTDDETWNMAMASSTCLAKIALTTADQVVAFVMPFLDKHINSPDWRRREASLQAFGSILEGPRHESLAPYMSQVIDVVIQKMSDPSVPVKDTAAWTIGRICEFHTQSILPQHWQLLMRAPPPENPNGEGEGVLLTGLKDDPRVAANVCWALHNLADQLEESRNQQTNPLSPLFITIARALLQASDREDASENNLRCSAYEALNTTLQNAAADTRVHIEQLLPVILERLQKTFSMQIVSNDDKEQQNELQGLLCGTLQVIVQKLGPAAVPFADSLMQLFLQLCSNMNSSLQEEVLMGIGAVAVGARARRKEGGAGPHRACCIALPINSHSPRAHHAAAHTHTHASPRALRTVDGPLRSRMPPRPPSGAMRSVILPIISSTL